MVSLSTLKNSHRKQKDGKRVGRGIGSNRGVTCGRGTKGQGARSGAKRRHTYEGGQFRLFMKLPTRGFTRGRFLKRLDSINLRQIEGLYSDGEVVNMTTLRAHGFISGRSYGIKVLGEGELTKKVKLEVTAVSDGARAKLEAAKVEYTIIK